jgi:CxxC motif-containing protein (DUF1111 family)
MTRRTFPLGLLVFAFLLFPLMAFAQTDPGVRGGAAGAGGPLASVAANSPAGILNFFNASQDAFEEIDSVSGTVAGEEGSGLGPRFNSNACSACHAQPAVGGTAPAINPQVADATRDGATNVVPSFISSTGPVREARFPFFFDAFGNPDTSRPNGGVEDLYTIKGRVDAPGCTFPNVNGSTQGQPSFAQAVNTGNIIFRIPTPTFGSGLIENIEESTLLANAAANASNSFGITGTFNREGNAGTIARFGWKAQNKSLEIFAGEAYLVEQGVSNELFGQERPLPGEGMASPGLPASCKFNSTPEDITRFDGVGAGVMSDTVAFAMFMRLLAPPTPSTTVPGGATSINNGRNLFNAIGCNVCHTPSLTTFRSHFTSSLNNATANLFSDMEIHHMGSLNDNVSQGGAGGDQFRTAPLWGLGKRIFFLHDGRTTNLINAILAHNSSGSEANGPSFNFFVNLSVAQQQDVLNFLRSL